jgi:hypothetical protein
MPVIARFYGIVIKMYFSQSEHGSPIFTLFTASSTAFSTSRLWR